jgi:hypothetical protein
LEAVIPNLLDVMGKGRLVWVNLRPKRFGGFSVCGVEYLGKGRPYR